MTTINDRKTPAPLSAPFDDVAEYFLPTILMEMDYFPCLSGRQAFGMQLFDPGTLSLDGEYRFGFGGHELDNEIKGAGNHLSFGDYGYDPRLGRRWNLDPVDQVSISNYAAFANNPIIFIDPDGKRVFIHGDENFQYQTFTAMQALTNDKLVMLKSGEVVIYTHHIPSEEIKRAGNPVKVSDKELTNGTFLVREVLANSSFTNVREDDRNTASGGRS